MNDKSTIHRSGKTAGNAESADSAETVVYRSEDETVATVSDDDASEKTIISADAPKGPDLDPRAADWIGVGSVIKDRFILQDLLGKGGMGSVFRAIDKRKQEAGDNEPYVAIKVLGENFKQHQHAFVSLQREAKKTNQLAHPNIVTVYDFDRDGELIYLTMEELTGWSLKEALSRKDGIAALTLKQKIDLIRQIAQGLAYAHSKGIVHSDLKPANIFLTKDYRIKILDFGIARAANADADNDSFDAGVLGALTEAYASLEMFNNDPPHPSDDIYALGIVACEILANKHPYARRNATDAFEQKRKATIPKKSNIFLQRLLKSSLALKRKQRVPNAEIFLKKLNRAVNAPKLLSAGAAVAVVAIAANYFYIQTIDLEAIPFDSLPQEAQLDFNNYLEEANRALSFNDLQGAVGYIDQAYQIHATSDDMIAIKERIAGIVFNTLAQASTPEQRETARSTINFLTQYAAFGDLDEKTPN